MRSSTFGLAAALACAAACGGHDSPGNGPDGGGPIDAPTGDPCTGSATRCEGGTFQQCVGGFFNGGQACANACSDTLGCVDCDPSQGSNTCEGSAVVVCNPDGSFGSNVAACGSGEACQGGACNAVCTADGVDLVYVVDEQNDFMSFDPRLLPGNPFTKIGTLACPTHGASLEPNQGVVPQSMSVDRDGVAWVEYTSGEVFNVSLTDATCTATAWVPQAGGMALFGMGFVTDTAGSDSEHLFIAGGGDDAQPNGKLATVDTHGGNLTPVQVGSLTETSDYSPELTGTNQAELFGFFPVLTSGPAYVQQIDRTSGAGIGSAFDLGSAGLGGAVRDWAFAQWGGTFYVFVTTTDSNGNNANSTVRAIDRATGAYSVILQNLAFNIDGAGVSTCAPSVIDLSTPPSGAAARARPPAVDVAR